MGLKMQQFKCSECKHEQEELIRNEEAPENKCEKCGAEPDKLIQVFGTPSHGKHVSWTQW